MALIRYLILAFIRLNIVNGPWAEDIWYKTIMDGLNDLFHKGAAPLNGNALFYYYMADMLQEEDNADIRDDPNASQLLWERLKTTHPFTSKGATVCMNRFMEVVRNIKSHLKSYSTRTCIMVFVAIEMGLFEKFKIQKGYRERKYCGQEH